MPTTTTIVSRAEGTVPRGDYLPLAIFLAPEDGAQRLIGAMLRSGKGGNAGVLGAIGLAVAIVRERFPRIKIILRADAGFGNAQTLGLCDKLKLSYCLGLAGNTCLTDLSTRTQMKACCRYAFAKAQWQGDGVCRVFGRFDYKAGTWKRKHNVVVKAEITRRPSEDTVLSSRLRNYFEVVVVKRFAVTKNSVSDHE